MTARSEDVSRDSRMNLCALSAMRGGILRKRPYQFKKIKKVSESVGSVGRIRESWKISHACLQIFPLYGLIILLLFK